VKSARTDTPKPKSASAVAFDRSMIDRALSEVIMSAEEKIDWSQCPLVEVHPRVQSGAPVLRGTRMPVDAIVDNFDYGMSASEISNQFEVPQDIIEAILAYAKSHRFAHSLR
jgi:uncharacterized protein (DUF433 family)